MNKSKCLLVKTFLRLIRATNSITLRLYPPQSVKQSGSGNSKAFLYCPEKSHEDVHPRMEIDGARLA